MKKEPKWLPPFIASIPTAFCLVLGFVSLFCLFVFGGVGLSYAAFCSESPISIYKNQIQTIEIGACIIIGVCSFVCSAINAINDKERMASRRSASCPNPHCHAPEDNTANEQKTAKVSLAVALMLLPMHCFVDADISKMCISVFASICMGTLIIALRKRKKLIVEYLFFGLMCHVLVFCLLSRT